MTPRKQPKPPVAVTKDLIAQHGLTEEEYQKVISLIGREPNLTELGIFSVMWSEHCSYKSSRAFLKKLPTEGPHVIQGPGENAGVVDIGDGLAAVCKIGQRTGTSSAAWWQESQVTATASVCPLWEGRSISTTSTITTRW